MLENVEEDTGERGLERRPGQMKDLKETKSYGYGIDGQCTITFPPFPSSTEWKGHNTTKRRQLRSELGISHRYCVSGNAVNLLNLKGAR
jgi:hypothetical protein